VVERLRHQRVELLEGEFGSSGYSGHNWGWLIAIYLVALRNGDAEVMDLALRVMALMLAVEEFLRAPEGAHPTLRGHSFIPGSRCADRRGYDEDRDDIGRDAMAGKPVGRDPKSGHQHIEVWMVRNAVAAGLLPPIAPAPIESVRPRWRLRIRHFAHGMEAVFIDGMPRSIAPLYALSVDWRKALLPDGVRGGAAEWVAWDDVEPSYKPRGWEVPGGPLPRQLPARDLGRLLSEVTLGGDAGSAPGPAPQPPPPFPKPGPQPKPPAPPPTPPAAGHAARWLLHTLEGRAGIAKAAQGAPLRWADPLPAGEKVTVVARDTRTAEAVHLAAASGPAGTKVTIVGTDEGRLLVDVLDRANDDRPATLVVELAGDAQLFRPLLFIREHRKP
jgi:hypothetical protein